MKLCKNEPAHQEHIIADQHHLVGFECSDVIAMEKAFGSHIEGCKFVGYVAATKCCQKDKK